MVFLLSPAPDSRAQWSSNPTVNTPICTAPLGQSNSVATSDGAGGAIIAWVDNRGADAEIYAQRVNAAGVVQWAIDGIVICGVVGDQLNPAVMSDGAGGAIITWQDFRFGVDFDIYAQRVNAAGGLLWGPGGMPVCDAASDQIWPMLVTDGAGGAIVTWMSFDTTSDYDIYAQRVNGAGVRQWPPLVAGIPICTAANGQWWPKLVADGAGGAIITWYDGRVGGIPDPDIYARRVTGAGVPVWAPDGVLVCGWPFIAGAQYLPTIASDGTGGAIITWYDQRFDAGDIYAQRVTAGGGMFWVLGGVPVCGAANAQQFPNIVSDGAGGAIITWEDERLAPGVWDVYAQRVDGTGVFLWAPDGASVGPPAGDRRLPKIVGDGAGGAIVAWNNPIVGVPESDIQAQRFDAGGAVQWPPSGVQITIAPNVQDWQFQFMPMVADGAGGAIISWTDQRGTVATDIYAQNVNSDGTLGPRPLAYWRFEEGSGTTAGDASGNGHTGTFWGAPQFSTDVPSSSVRSLPNSYSLDFDPDPTPPYWDAVDVPDSPTLRPANGITVEAWVRPRGPGVVISKHFYDPGPPPRDASSFELGVWGPPNGGIRFGLCSASGTQAVVTAFPNPVTPVMDQWMHVAGTWDSASGTMRLYVDFVEVASAPFAGPIGYTTSPIMIGSGSGPGGLGRFDLFMGEIDEVRVFDRALTPTEMLRISSPLAPLVFVSNPTPGDTLIQATRYNIRWVAIDDGGVSSVRIELTRNGGATYGVLSANEPNDSTYTWVVPAINTNTECQIRITAYDGATSAGVGSSPGFFRIVAPTGTGIDIGDMRPLLALDSPCPNPFNPTSRISYSVPAEGPVDLSIYDVLGHRVRTLVCGPRPAGKHVATWNGRDASGAASASGVYFVRLESGGKVLSRKAVLSR